MAGRHFRHRYFRRFQIPLRCGILAPSMKRRDFLRHTALVGSALLIGKTLSGCASRPGSAPAPRLGTKPFALEEMSVAELQRGMASGRFTAAALVRQYLRRIEEVDRRGPRLKAVLELNPDALAIAQALDQERKAKGPRGPFHGIPVLIKDNIDTHDRLCTTAGSLALAGSIAPRDAFIVERLRAAGAVILGKTNLSEWANFRGSRSISGWSDRGLTRNPYAIDRPSGSSSGSAVAVSAKRASPSGRRRMVHRFTGVLLRCCGPGRRRPCQRSGIIPISASQTPPGRRPHVPTRRCRRDGRRDCAMPRPKPGRQDGDYTGSST